MKQSDLDPCLFIGVKVICVVYVDDLLFWSTTNQNIIDLANLLREEGVELEEEGDAAGFLGVKLERDADGRRLRMTQCGLIDRVISALDLDDPSTKLKATPADRKPLVKDADGPPSDAAFSYASVVGMLLYLAGHSRPDIAYAVNCCARYTFCPKRSHIAALKRIGRYLKLTRDKGLILDPMEELKIEAFPDADFAGLYSYEESTDPTCTQSRTGFVINVANCPVFWQSKLQSETALSTMEAKVVVFCACCRELIPILDIVKQIGDAVGLSSSKATTLNVKVHEDNAGALILMNTKPPQYTHRSKHYAIKTNWIREQIQARGIVVVKIDTKEQKGDIFTKSPLVQFVYLRRLILVW